MSSWRHDESHPRRITKHHSIGGACSSHACPACSSDEPPSRHQQLVHGSSQSYTEWNVVGGSGGNVGGVSSRNLSIDLNESGSGSSNKSPHANELGESAPHATAGIRPSQSSTCVEPDHRELIRSVSVVLHRRIRDNEDAESKLLLPLFCEDTHTEAPPEPTYEVSMPTLPVQALGFVSLYTLTELPPPPVIPRVYDVPDVATVCDFIENIWHRARLTPQSVVICLIYVDRLEARSAGVLLHARSWRPIVFASLLLVRPPAETAVCPA